MISKTAGRFTITASDYAKNGQDIYGCNLQIKHGDEVTYITMSSEELHNLKYIAESVIRQVEGCKP